MSDNWVELRVNLKNKHGLHMRPAQKIVETATRYKADIRAVKDGLDMSAKSILDMIEFASHMVNAAAEDDNEFVFKAKGEDADAALADLNKLIDDKFGME
ncbi:MAG: HPr family phosphocarrier protein [Planctomycetes bacterium]|nr:HPr family phosphocarrier protein [Planctomycetota bacterium]